MSPISMDKNLLFLFADHQIQPSRSAKFSFPLGGQKLEGFLVNQSGKFFAYLNKCRHLGITLDWDTNEGSRIGPAFY